MAGWVRVRNSDSARRRAAACCTFAFFGRPTAAQQKHRSRERECIRASELSCHSTSSLERLSEKRRASSARTSEMA